MADNVPPQKAKASHMSHLHSEPVPISFSSSDFFNSLKKEPPNVLPNVSKQPMAQPSSTSANVANANNVTSPPSQPVTASSTVSQSSVAAPASEKSKLFKPLAPQSVDVNKFTGFKFVTLDNLVNETREIYDIISGTFQWEMCEGQTDRCIETIKDKCQTKRVFLVSSGGLAKEVVPKIHDLPQLYAVYIYCANVKYHSEWSEKYTKVRVVCDNDDRDLLPKFAVDVAQANIDWGNGCLKAGLIDKANEKFKAAAERLAMYPGKYDEAMDLEVKNKLAECNKT